MNNVHNIHWSYQPPPGWYFMPGARTLHYMETFPEVTGATRLHEYRADTTDWNSEHLRSISTPRRGWTAICHGGPRWQSDSLYFAELPVHPYTGYPHCTNCTQRLERRRR